MLDIDAIRKTVSIIPLHPGGANFETHVLSKTRNGYKFKPSIINAMFSAIFATVGYGFLVGGIYKYKNTSDFNLFTINPLLLVVGTIFFLAANWLLYLHFKPIVFNKNNNIFYTGFKGSPFQKSTKLNKIVALQILGETIKGDNGSYKSFELNLVLDDASRLHVIDHGKLKALLDDTEVLSKYLNVPIWHAKSNKT